MLKAYSSLTITEVSDGKNGTTMVWKGQFASNQDVEALGTPQNGWCYYNTTNKVSLVYQDGSWYEMNYDGSDGTNGITYYTWIKYADDDMGSGMSDRPENKKYLGIAYNKTESELEDPKSNDPTQYSWSLIQGAAGEDAYTVILTNESHVFAGNTSAAIESTVTCGVIAYKGSTQVAAKIGEVTGMPAGMTVTVFNNNSKAARLDISVSAAMATKSGELTIPITVDGKTFTKKFAFSLALSGSDGVSPKSLQLSTDRQVISYSSDGTLKDLNPITLTANQQNYSSDINWTTTPQVNLSGSGNTRTLDPKSFDLNSKIEITISSEDLSDTLTLVKVVDGTDVLITSTQIAYQAHTSGTDVPTGTWQSTVPEVAAGQYLWTRTIVTYNDDPPTSTTSYSVSRNGTNGGDAYTVVLSNESHVFAGNTTSAIPSTIVCNVMAYKGGSQAIATINEAGIKDIPSGMTVSVDNNARPANFSVSVDSSMATKSGELTIPITIDGKSFSKTFSFSLALSGVNGVSAKSLQLSSDRQVIACESNGTPKDNSSDITLTVNQQNYSEEITWTTSPQVPLTGVGNVRKLGISDFKTNKIEITVSSGGLTDTLTLVKVIDGANGADGTSISIVNTQVAYQVSTSGTNTPTGEWKNTVPSAEAGEYLWTRTIVTYSDTSSTTSYSVSRNGTNGTNGQTFYTWVMYATSDKGDNITSNPEGMSYIGIAYNQKSAVPSENPADYTWSLFKGADGSEALVDIRYSDDMLTFTLDDEGNAIGTKLGKYIGFRLVDKIPSTAEELGNTFNDYVWSVRQDDTVTYSIVPDVEIIHKFLTTNREGNYVYEFSPNIITFKVHKNVNNQSYQLNGEDFRYYLQVITEGESNNNIENYPVDNTYLPLGADINMSDIYEQIPNNITQINIVVEEKASSNYSILVSKTLSVPYGMRDDMAKLQINATNILQSIGPTKLTFSANGLSIQNGAFEILSKEGESLLYADEDGNLVIKGVITASAGSIGGWIIGENELHSETNNTGLYSGNEHKVENSSVRFYAGTVDQKVTEKNFIVTEDGYLLARNADITGSIQATSGKITNVFNVGEDGNGIVIYGGDSTRQSFIGSNNFSSGTLGYGWQIRGDGSAEFTNIKARGKIQSSVFEYNKTSAIGGSLYITPTIHMDSKSVGTITESGDNYLINWNYPTASFENVCGRNWGINDELRIEGIVVLGDTKIDVSSKVAYIDKAVSISDQMTTITVRIAKSQFLPSEPTLVGGYFIEGALLMFYGAYVGESSWRQSGIYLTAVDNNGPFIDIYDVNSDGSIKHPSPAVRLGNLSGITDSSFVKEQGGTLSGYGLYSSNAYLTGQLILPGAGITNEAIPYTIGENNYGYVRLWAGAEKTSAQEAPFIVTSDGSLFASKGIFSGRIEATEGSFSGTIGTAGIVLVPEGTITSPNKGRDHFFVGYSENPESYDDYVLNIDDRGLSIWEGALRAYSDAAKNDSYTHPIYGYNKDYDNLKSPLPYFYLVDDSHNETNADSFILDSRIVSYKNHIFQLNNDSNKTWNSILLDNGIWFLSGEAGNQYNGSKETIEINAYNKHARGMGIYQEGDTLKFKSPSFYEFSQGLVNIKGMLNMSSEYNNSTIEIGGMSIQQTSNNNGINIF